MVLSRPGEVNSPTSPIITASDILGFAERSVNLHRDDLAKHLDQFNNLRDQVSTYISRNPDYNLVKPLNSGSVAKGTALKTINDMDVALYVRVARESVDEKRLLEWLVSRLREVYPTKAPSDFQVSQHCVRVSFKGSGLDVDVVPVLYEGDARDRGYLITRDTGEWVLTSIPLHLEFIRVRRERYDRHFAQVVRLAKWWVREQGKLDPEFHLKSFLVELLVAHLADTRVGLADYPAALESVFSYLVKSGFRERIAFADNYPPSSLPSSRNGVVEVYDPVTPGNNVAASLREPDRLRIVKSAQDAFDALTEAHHATTKGRALEMWRLVLGPSFGAG